MAAANASAACSLPDLRFSAEGGPWKPMPLSSLKRDTIYSVQPEDGGTVLKGTAEKSASLYAAVFARPIGVPAALGWRWKTDALVPDADNRAKEREDAPLRVIVAFDGDRNALPAEDRRRLKWAERLSGRPPPYATLMYIWSDHVPVDTLIPSAHTSRVKMLVVASGRDGLGHWQAVRRNLAADYRRTFGGEPGRLIGIAVMTDTDNTGGRAVGYYADLHLECATE